MGYSEQMRKPKTYFVTGSSGFIGKKLVESLTSDGHTVIPFDRNRGGDVRNSEQLERESNGANAIIHLAFINGTQNFYSKPEEVLSVALKGIINVIDACIKNDIPELYLASSSEVYQVPPIVPTPEEVPLSVPDVFNPRYSYGGGKIASELMAINYGRKHIKRVVIFRPHNLYGPPNKDSDHVVPVFINRMNEIPESDKAVPFSIQGSGEETRSFCYIDDMIEGIRVVMDKGSHLGIYNIGTQEEVTMKQLVHVIAKQFRKTVEIIPGKLQQGSAPRRCPDIAKLMKLGFKPRVSLEDGIRFTVNWFKEELKYEQGIKGAK